MFVYGNGGVSLSALATILGILIAALGSIVIPIVLFILHKKKKEREDLNERILLQSKELRTVEEHHMEEKLKDLRKSVLDLQEAIKTLAGEKDLKGCQRDLRTLMREVQDLQKNFLLRMPACQEKFILQDDYKKDLAVQRQYLKLMYGLIKKHREAIELESGEYPINGDF